MSTEKQSRQGLVYPSTREQALDTALQLARTNSFGTSADALIHNAKLIEAYLDGEDDPTPDESE